MSKRKILIDSMLNIIASAVPLALLQLIILPYVGASLGDVRYGSVVTLVSLSLLLSHPLGNVLNNIRLLQNNQYKGHNASGDFNILLSGSIIASSVVVFLGTIYYEGFFSLINVMLVVVISCLNLTREYLIVAFRIVLNYRAILINNVILGIGYLIGLFLFYLVGYWQLIYIVGAALSLLYIVKNSDLLKENFVKTPLFKETSFKSVILFIASFMNTALLYADKLVLFPLLGPTAVAVYYSATILGKITSMLVTPVSSVMLSYLVKMEIMQLKKFIYLLSITGLIGFAGYLIAILISEPLLNLLYPNWADRSMELIYVTTATAIISVIGSVIRPVILRFNNINWQIVISGINLIVTITAVFAFYSLYGLLGFCIGMLVAKVVSLIILTSIFIFSYQMDNDKRTSEEM